CTGLPELWHATRPRLQSGSCSSWLCKTAAHINTPAENALSAGAVDTKAALNRQVLIILTGAEVRQPLPGIPAALRSGI
uniref:Uncharacterized protein n=1 Tax=Denticeps clupeoides TaxID=299321 RepID=A0AAY4DYZ1_9TELE